MTAQNGGRWTARGDLIGGLASAALHAGVIGAMVWAAAPGAAPPAAPDGLVVSLALLPAPEPQPAPALEAPRPPAAAAPAPPLLSRRASPPRPSTPAAALAAPPRAAPPTDPAADGPAPAPGAMSGQPSPAGTAEAAAGSPAGSAEGGPTIAVAPASQAAEAIETPPPLYPMAARRRGVEGRVVLHLGIDAAGAVESVEIAQTSGAVTLDAAAIEAARLWRFRPARRDGQPVAATALVPIRFQLGGVAIARAE